MSVQRLNKKQAGYAVVARGLETTKGVSCAQCEFFSYGGKCHVVTSGVRGVDSCNLWTRGSLDLSFESGQKAHEILYKRKLTKSEAGYVCALPQSLREVKNKGFKCGTCEMFKDGMCDVVAGRISEFGCCNLHVFNGEHVDFTYIGGQDATKILQGLEGVEIVDIEDLVCE